MTTSTQTPGVFQWLMRPGMALMQRMNMRFKLMLMAAMLIVPLIVVLLALIEQLNSSADSTRLEQDGLVAVQALTRVATLTQTHRGQTNQILSGNAGAKPARDTTREALRKAMAEVDTVVSRLPHLDLDTRWQGVRSALGGFTQNDDSGARAQVFAAHTDQVNELMALVNYAGETSPCCWTPKPPPTF